MRVSAAALLIGIGGSVLLCACGLGGTAVSTAAGGASEVQQAQQARATEERVKRQLDEATRAAAEQRSAAESSAQ
jgi:hypothetical protein